MDANESDNADKGSKDDNVVGGEGKTMTRTRKDRR